MFFLPFVCGEWCHQQFINSTSVTFHGHRHLPKTHLPFCAKELNTSRASMFRPRRTIRDEEWCEQQTYNAHAIANGPPTVDFIVNCSLCDILFYRILAILAGVVPCVRVRCFYWCGCVLNDNYLCSTRWRRCRRYADRVSVSSCECVCKLKYIIHHRICVFLFFDHKLRRNGKTWNAKREKQWNLTGFDSRFLLLFFCFGQRRAFQFWYVFVCVYLQ